MAAVDLGMCICSGASHARGQPSPLLQNTMWKGFIFRCRADGGTLRCYWAALQGLLLSCTGLALLMLQSQHGIIYGSRCGTASAALVRRRLGGGSLWSRTTISQI